MGYKSFLKLYNDHEVIIYKRSNEIIKSAHERKLLGNPPVGQTQDTIGDEVNWETLLSNLKDDLYIISLDKTYELHDTFLRNEFKSRTGKELIIHNSISSVLKIIGQEPSEELDNFEKNILSTPVFSEILRQSMLLDYTAMGNIARVLEIGKSMPYNPAIGIAAQQIVSRTKSANSLHELEMCPQCGNNGLRGDNQCSSCGYKYDNDNQ